MPDFAAYVSTRHVLFPVAKAIGVHEVHYAMVIILAMGIGLFAPPFGLGYYAACTIGRVNPDVAVRRIWPYLGALLFGSFLKLVGPGDIGEAATLDDGRCVHRLDEQHTRSVGR